MEDNLQLGLSNYFSEYFIENKSRLLKKQYQKYGLVDFFVFEKFLSLAKRAIDGVAEEAYYLEKAGNIVECESLLIKQIVFFLHKNKDLLGKSFYAPICPGCLYMNKKVQVEVHKKVYRCFECEKAKSHDHAKYLNSIFCFYYNRGVSCPGCNRFVPYRMDMSWNMQCPYEDCLLTFQRKDAKRAEHPIIKSIRSPNIFDYDAICGLKDTGQIELENTISTIESILESEISRLSYGNFTSAAKIKMAEAFISILKRNTNSMLSYLINKSRAEKIQHKIFQEYVSLVEKSLPFQIRKNRKKRTIESLLDEEFNLFYGISEFESCIENYEVKNKTKETFFIGGKDTPFYIGKLLDVIDCETNESVMNLVDEYSFFKVKFNSKCKSKRVIVRHMRIPPHYQMGHMVYLNKTRKLLSDSLEKLNLNSY